MNSRGKEIKQLARGNSTAVGINVSYRLNKLQQKDLLHGKWLDCGCADGGYTITMEEWGVEEVLGIDIDASRVTAAKNKIRKSRISFCCANSSNLPFAVSHFDGVFLNEVLEHVEREIDTLSEIYRILKPGGVLAVISPNRWFPFEGHGLRLGKSSIGLPIPFLPWLPRLITSKFMNARNYWPNELRNIIAGSGFRVMEVSTIFPVFEVYPWLPGSIIRKYREIMPQIENVPIVRKFGVSTFVLAQRPV